MYDPGVLDDTHNLSEQEIDTMYRSIPDDHHLSTDKKTNSVFIADQIPDEINEQDEIEEAKFVEYQK